MNDLIVINSLIGLLMAAFVLCRMVQALGDERTEGFTTFVAGVVLLLAILTALAFGSFAWKAIENAM